MSKRYWKKEGPYYWRCAPWTICIAYLDGCSLYCLSKDGIDQPIAFKEDLDEVMKVAKEMEAANA